MYVPSRIAFIHVTNLLYSQYPACIIPFGKASKELDPEKMETGDDVQPDCVFFPPFAGLIS